MRRTLNLVVGLLVVVGGPVLVARFFWWFFGRFGLVTGDRVGFTTVCTIFGPLVLGAVVVGLRSLADADWPMDMVGWVTKQATKWLPKPRQKPVPLEELARAARKEPVGRARRFIA